MILERETGLEISRATLDGWVMRVGQLLTPIVAVMRRELVVGSYIQADETPVDVQLHDGRGQNHQAYLWQYGKPGGGVVFDFRLGRGREGPKEFLGQFEGILQTDGYAAYDHVGGPRSWYMPFVGRTRGASFTRRQNSIPAVPWRRVSWRKSTNCSRSMPKRASRNSTIPDVMRYVWNELRPSWQSSIRRSRQRVPPRCLPRPGQGGELHPHAMAKAHAISGLSRTGTEQ